MKTYVFYTDEGFTYAPDGTQVENLQILGIESGHTEKDALAKLYGNNERITDGGFTESRIGCFVVSSWSGVGEISPRACNDLQ